MRWLPDPLQPLLWKVWWRVHARQALLGCWTRSPKFTSLTLQLVEMAHFLPMALLTWSWVSLFWLDGELRPYAGLYFYLVAFHTIAFFFPLRLYPLWWVMAGFMLLNVILCAWSWDDTRGFVFQEEWKVFLFQFGIVSLLTPPVLAGMELWLTNGFTSSFYQRFLLHLYGPSDAVELDEPRQFLRAKEIGLHRNMYDPLHEWDVRLEHPSHTWRKRVWLWALNPAAQAREEEQLLALRWGTKPVAIVSEEPAPLPAKKRRF